MEVHAHSHTPRKKWTHYLFEFLMLFLAVFCGFLAENQREHMIEKQREAKYMKSMLEDLTADTAMLSLNIHLRQERIKMADSLVILLNSPSRNEKGNDIYFLGRSISPPANIFPNDGTIQQLKSSGSLRLIRHHNIAGSILAYDQKMRNVLFEMGDEIDIRGEYRQLARKIFNTNVFHEMLRTAASARPVNNPQLYSKDDILLNEFIGQIYYVKRVHQAQLVRSNELLVQAKQLLADIKKEYHLK